MKQNGNNLKQGDYYIGLDVGTNSVGWAVTDIDYKVCRQKGKSMWGVRLFDEALDASERRTNRTARRRLARQKQRFDYLKMLFANEITKVDKNFFMRLSESSLYAEDKSENSGKYSLFCDENFTDIDYYSLYPTAYHLRSAIINSDTPFDVRLVFLAIHHIFAHRGHFLYATDSKEIKKIETSFKELCDYISSEYDVEFSPENYEEYLKTLKNGNLNITEKKKALKAAYGIFKENDYINLNSVSDMLSGATVKFSDLFLDDELKEAEVKNFSLKKSLDDEFDKISEVLGDRIEVLMLLKNIFDIARLSQMLGKNDYISEAKVELFNKNKSDLQTLKQYVKRTSPEKYKSIFSDKKDKLNNFAAYSGYKLSSGDYTCKQEDFCAFLKKELIKPDENDEFYPLYKEIEDKTFLTKLMGVDNGVIPYQLHKRELEKILSNASLYLDFLSEKDESGKTVSEKIIDTFEFRIPYYVGPLNSKSDKSWVVRKDEKIYPWNFEKIVDVEESAKGFIENLIGKCTYTGEKVIPMDSLLYSKFRVLNEINPLKINGEPVSVETKQFIYQELFEKSNAKVTKKKILDCLVSNNMAQKTDEISGVDDVIKSKLKSYHDFKQIFDKTGDTEMVESIIKSVLIFSDDKKMLRRWLYANCKGLDDKDIAYICRLKYKDWGRFSKEFLTELHYVDELREAHSIIDMLYNTNNNLMQLLSDNFTFAKLAEKMRLDNLGGDETLNDKIDDMYIAPSVRRSVRQSLKLVDEIVDIKKSAPKKIFIEVARTSVKEMKGKRTDSRKEKLLALYKNCKEVSAELFEQLKNEDESKLRSDKLFLYYTQFGKCMYTGEQIDISDILADNKTYDIDHIFPQSKVIDDSLDNRVLVNSKENREKTNIYPIKKEIREKMIGFWSMLFDKGLISEKKFNRLKRSTPLTADELSSFVARQIVETQQSTKALTELFNDYYPSKIVFSKAGNVSRFRQEFDLIKCRDINDLHHAKDAYLNVVVGNVFDTKFTEKFFLNIDKENYSLNKVFDFDTPNAWKKDVTINTVKKYMSRNDILVTRMPHITKGQLFDVQLRPKGADLLPAKDGRDTEKYGGYNSLKGAYFFVAEHTSKKNRIRTIEPVYIYKQDLYEADPVKYCTEILGLIEPEIIAPIIRIDAMLELDGMRYNICGRTGNQIIYQHTCQLVLNKEFESYIKRLGKYCERCKTVNKELPITIAERITKEENIALYDAFVLKLKTSVYSALFKNVLKDLEDNKNVFENLNLFEQSKLLLEILKAFRCNTVYPNFKELCGKSTVGKVQLSKSVSNYSSAYLINQSVTGMYEVKVDLLK